MGAGGRLVHRRRGNRASPRPGLHEGLDVGVGRDGQLGERLDVGTSRRMLPHAQIRLAGIQQIAHPLLVDLHVRHLDLEGPFRRGEGVDALEELLADVGDHARLARGAAHRVALAGTRLSARDDAGVVACQGVVKKRHPQVKMHRVLRGVRRGVAGVAGGPVAVVWLSAAPAALPPPPTHDLSNANDLVSLVGAWSTGSASAPQQERDPRRRAVPSRSCSHPSTRALEAQAGPSAAARDGERRRSAQHGVTHHSCPGRSRGRYAGDIAPRRRCSPGPCATSDRVGSKGHFESTAQQRNLDLAARPRACRELVLVCSSCEWCSTVSRGNFLTNCRPMQNDMRPPTPHLPPPQQRISSTQRAPRS